MLDIRLLGPPLVYLDGELTTIQRRATRVLFFYLATNQEPIGRLQLCDLLWSETEGEKKQRSNLRRALDHLKKALPNIEVIKTYNGMVGLAQNQLRVDVREFTSAVEKMRQFSSLWQEGLTLPPNLYQELVKAANLWRGSTFIDNTNDMCLSSRLTDWWQEKDREFKKDQLDLFKFLAHLEGALGTPKKAISWAEKALAVDDYDDEAHFILLRSLHRAGEDEKARQHYLSFEERREEEFGEALSERVRALGRELFQQREASPSHARPEWTIRPSVHVPFVGQQDAIQILRRNYLNGGATLVLGEAGAGKTRLVQEFYQSLEIPPRLLLLPCYPVNENLPYQPWVDMLRRSIGEDIWGNLPTLWIEPLTMLLPELREGRDDLSGDASTPYAKSIIFEAIKNLLSLVAKEQPCLLFVDDVQWADGATLGLLTYLLQQSFFERGNLRLVITSRVEEKNPGLNQFLLNALTSRLEVVEMLRLNEEDISELAFHLLEEKLSPTTSTHLLRETGGNPFLLLEMLSAIWALPDRGNLNASLPVPASVKRLIEMRLNNLSSLAKDILLLAAIQGNPFELALLEKTSSLSLDEMTLVIGELEDAQLIREASQRNSLEYAFVHEKIREELISSLTSIQNRFLHKKVAQALEARSGESQNSQAAVLAEHYEKAGEFSRAFDLWIQAGKYAYQLFSIDDASTAYRRAESLISETALSNEQIYTLYAMWGSMLFRSDSPDKLEEVMQTLLSIGEERSSNLLSGVALDGLSDVCMTRNQFEKGLEYTEEALPLLKISGHIPAQMNALIHHGVFLYMLNKFAASKESFQTALDLGEGKEDQTSLYFLGNANYQMATILTGMGWPLMALSYAKQSLQAMRLSHVPHGSILPHSIMGLANYYLANYKEGRDHALKSVALATQTDSWRMLGYGSSYAGMNETELASFGSAWKHAQKAIQLGDKYGHTEIVSMGYKVLGDIYTHLDAFPQAAEAYQQGVEVDKGSFAMLENLARLGVTLSLLGDPKGDTLLQQALVNAKAAGLESIFWNAKSLELGTFVLHDNRAAFEENFPLVENAFKERTHPNAAAWIEYLQAFFSLLHGEPEKALTRLETLLPTLENTPFFWIKFRTLKLYAQILQSLEQESAAPRAELEEMLQKIERGLGDAPIQEEWRGFVEGVRGL